MFDNINRQRSKKVMETLDLVNRSLGTEIVRFAVQGFEKRYRLKREYLSQRYTTNIDEVLHIKI
jgi:DNA polymerase V